MEVENVHTNECGCILILTCKSGGGRGEWQLWFGELWLINAKSFMIDCHDFLVRLNQSCKEH